METVGSTSIECFSWLSLAKHSSTVMENCMDEIMCCVLNEEWWSCLSCVTRSIVGYGEILLDFFCWNIPHKWVGCVETVLVYCLQYMCFQRGSTESWLRPSVMNDDEAFSSTHCFARASSDAQVADGIVSVSSVAVSLSIVRDNFFERLQSFHGCLTSFCSEILVRVGEQKRDLPC